MRLLREMQDEDLATWHRLQFEAAQRLRRLPSDVGEASLVMSGVSIALVSYALDCTAEEAASLAPSVRRQIVAVQDALNAAHLYAGVVANG